MEDTTQETVFSWIERILHNGDAEAAFERLIDRFRTEKRYRQLFDARLMKKRWELGLPLVSQPALADVPQELRQQYQDSYVEAATEVGRLYLADGDIPRAWTYFRALGNTQPVRDALATFVAPESETPESQELLGATIQIAFQEGVHPRKGLELILEHYGMCRAITMFNAYPQQDGRNESLRLLVKALHAELVTSLKRAISTVEPGPETNSIPTLIAGREWLFENNAQYTDSSHVISVLGLSGAVDDEETLRLAVELADYGTHLGPMFQYAEDPPFDRAYEDRRIYLKALLGEDVDRAVQHFEEKAAAFDPHRDGTRPAEVLVELLIRLGRYDDAIVAFRRHLMDASPEELSCPSLLQLCQMAGDFAQLKDVAQQQSDPLGYLAALLQDRRLR